MIDAFFRPKGVAILGASSNPTKAGHQIVANMKDAGYQGPIYPVNPKGGEILGLKCYTSLDSIPGRVELAVLAVPAGVVDSVISDLQARHSRIADTRAMVVTAAGFSETGTEEDRRKEYRLLTTCRTLGIRVLGPNCVGVIDNISGVDTTFIMGATRRKGGITVVSQSGSVGAWLMETWASGPCPMGFNKFISVGNMADVDLVEIFEYLRDDDSTSVVGLYLEGYRQGRRLAEAMQLLANKKPVVVLKVGRSDRGAQAAHSHTGSMAGSDKVYDGVLKQTGARRVDTIEELSDTLKAFDGLPPLRGSKLFLVTQAGGPGIHCTDTIANLSELRYARVSDKTKETLKNALPSFASVCRPEGYTDVTAAASALQQAQAVETVLREPTVDAAVFVTVPVLFVPPEEVARELVEAMNRLRRDGIVKPIVSVLLAGRTVAAARQILEENGLSTFESPDRAVRALNHVAAYARFMSRRRETRKGGDGDNEPIPR